MEDEEFLKAKDTKKTVRRFIRSMGRQRVRLAIVLISVACYIVLNVAAPLFSAKVVDILWDLLKESRAAGTTFSITWERGGREIAMFLAVCGGAGAFYLLQSMLMASFAEVMGLQLRKENSEKLHRLPLAYYDRHQAGEVMSRVTNDLDKMAEALQTGMLRLFLAVGNIVGCLAIMLHLSIALTILFLLFMGLALILTNIVSRKTLRGATKRQECVGTLNGMVEEFYSGRAIIQAFNYEKTSSERVHEASENLAKASREVDFLVNAINPAVRQVNRWGMAVITVTGGWMLLKGRLSPGSFQAFFQYVNQAGEPITELSYMLNSLQSALASMERVYELLDEEELTPEPSPAKELKNAKGDVQFCDVRFGYTPQKILMQDISFSAKPGQKIAVVGSTGAGKTTLINLLMRFYDPNGGKILLDGVDTREMTRAGLRANFGMVLQDTWLFAGTIAENIAYGRPDASREEIIAAAKAARADFFIRTLPHGYDTMLSEDAETISVGQRQLLTIARVFLCDPAILILDEATSSVDTRTEMEIGKAMKALMHNRTSFVIAHRLSTILDADQILVMQDGNIIEQGTHAQLLEQGGAYAGLYNSQFA